MNSNQNESVNVLGDQLCVLFPLLFLGAIAPRDVSYYLHLVGFKCAVSGGKQKFCLTIPQREDSAGRGAAVCFGERDCLQ